MKGLLIPEEKLEHLITLAARKHEFCKANIPFITLLNSKIIEYSSHNHHTTVDTVNKINARIKSRIKEQEDKEKALTIKKERVFELVKTLAKGGYHKPDIVRYATRLVEEIEGI